MFPLAAVAAAAFAEEKPAAPIAGTGDAEGIRLPERGSTAPGFLLKDTAGEPFHFEAEWANHTYMLIFWSVFCEPCRLQMAVAQNVYEKYRDAGLRVAAVALDGEPMRAVIAGFVKQEGYTFQVLVDELGDREKFKVADPYGVSGMPSTFLVEKGGRIALSRAGLIAAEELEKSLKSVLKP